MSESQTVTKFTDLGLPKPILQAIEEVGYETPSPVQAECIPPLLEGQDIIGQAQTGTGKTAAFALPLLSSIDSSARHTQLLVLAPTRELAIQVAEAMQSYAKHLKDFHVLPIYGGQSYANQLRPLKRGVQVVVGTPGRVMDHMRRGTLKLDRLQALVLDEADEMLRMGFIDDVEWVLEHVPEECQIALFSATMPKEIRRVSRKHLKDPKEIQIKSATATASTIRQRSLFTNNKQKLDALTRILEIETFDGVIIFVRTKTQTTELADKLNARGFVSEALNGDIPQARRETIVSQLKAGKVDILIATDVVARGLDVERVSHVINYDIPYDTESYVHRIGRTGRAGREGDAILFVTAREKRMLQSIQKATKQDITEMKVPGRDEINASRKARFKQRISDTIANESLDDYQDLVQELMRDGEIDPAVIAAALAHMVQGGRSLLVEDLPEIAQGGRDRNSNRRERDGERPSRRERGERAPRQKKPEPRAEDYKPIQLTDYPDVKMVRYRIDVGYEHDAKPGNIVGAIANEGDIESRYIGHIEIYDEYSTVDLPDGMPKETFHALQNARVFKHKLNIKPFKKDDKSDSGAGGKKERKKSPKKASKGPQSDSNQGSNSGSNQRGKAPGKKAPKKANGAPKRAKPKSSGKSNDAQPRIPRKRQISS